MASEIRKVGIVGAGQMGKGIAQVCALAGFDVALNDVSEQRIAAGIEDISALLSRAVEKGQIGEDERAAAVARLRPAKDYAAFADSDLVIEAATENEEVKRDILAALGPSLRPGAMIGTNTSSISITRLAAVTGRPEQFIGIHS